LPRIKKNPRRVTMFGWSHMGSNFTQKFHCEYCISQAHIQAFSAAKTYVVSKNIVGDGRLVDAGIFVRFKVNERIFGDAVRNSGFYQGFKDQLLMS
jgi:hypothetical protein